MCKDRDCDVVNIGSLKILSALLTKYYNWKVSFLIDEYDMSLMQAFEQDYYKSMVILMKSLFEQALKTNDNLKFTVFSRCYLADHLLFYYRNKFVLVTKG